VVSTLKVASVPQRDGERQSYRPLYAKPAEGGLIAVPPEGLVIGNRSHSLRKLCTLGRLYIHSPDSLCMPKPYNPCSPTEQFGYRIEMSARPPCRRHRTSPS